MGGAQSFGADTQEWRKKRGPAKPGSLAPSVQALSLRADVSAGKMICPSEDTNSVTLKSEGKAHFEEENTQMNSEMLT